MSALSSVPEPDTVAEFFAVRHSKWVNPVLVHLSGGTLRFSELKREIDGVSQKALTVALRELERNGFITRTVFVTIPPRTDYALTDLGVRLLGVLGLIEDFMRSHWDEVLLSREAFDRAAQEPPAIRLLSSR